MLRFLPLVLVCATWNCASRGAGSSSRFAELPLAEVARLDRQRTLIAGLVKQRYGARSLTKTTSDLQFLQRLLDDHAFSKTQTYELQSLGVAFGDVLASELGLRWMLITDEYGTDPTLRFGNTTIQINALTMVSKRVERGDAVNLATLVKQSRDALAKARGAGW